MKGIFCFTLLISVICGQYVTTQFGDSVTIYQTGEQFCTFGEMYPSCSNGVPYLNYCKANTSCTQGCYAKNYDGAMCIQNLPKLENMLVQYAYLNESDCQDEDDLWFGLTINVLNNCIMFNGAYNTYNCNSTGYTIDYFADIKCTQPKYHKFFPFDSQCEENEQSHIYQTCFN